MVQAFPKMAREIRTVWSAPHCERNPAYIGGSEGHTKKISALAYKQMGIYQIAYVNWIYVSFMEGVHMSIRQKSVGKKR